MDLELLELRELAKQRKEDEKSDWVECFTDPSLYCLLVFFTLVMVFLLSGCQRREGSPLMRPYEHHMISLTSRSYRDPFTGQFAVYLQWPSSSQRPLGWFIRRVNLLTAETVLAVREGRVNFYRDERVSPGTYVYSLSTFDEAGERTVAKTKVSVSGEPLLLEEISNAK